MMRLFRIDTGETDHVAARNEVEAEAFFRSIYTDAGGGMHYSITEVPREQWATMVVHDDYVPGGKTTAAAIIGDPEHEREPIHVSSTVF